MGRLLDDFKRFIESEDFLRFLDKVNFVDKLNEKYFKKFESFSVEKQNKLIEKIIEKYSSKEYKDREYSKGRMPDEYLYHILFLYASNRCPDISEKYSNLPFFAGAFRINKKFDIVKYLGQGTLYQIYKL